MASQADVRRIALALPGTTEGPDGFRFAVEGKPIAWVWLERDGPKGPRRPNPEVIAVRVAGGAAKDAWLALDEAIFFTEPHYDGYPAVLVRLAAIDEALLTRILTDAWRVQAPRRLVRALDATAGGAIGS